MTIFIFALLSVVTILGALGVVCFRHPLYSVLSLVGTLMTMALFYAMLQAYFLALAHMIVYAGAIMVLFLYVLMLMDVRQEKNRVVRHRWRIFSALVVTCLAGVVVLHMRPYGVCMQKVVLLKGTIGSVGKLLFSEYALPFELTSILFLASVVGVVLITQKRGDSR